MKIVFWGTPEYAAENLLCILNTGQEVSAVVTQPDRRRGRGNRLTPSPVKQVAKNSGIPVYTTDSISKDEKTKKILFNLNADIYIVVAFGQILPEDILKQPKLGCWNSHASLLPKWRGAAPIQWSILMNDSKTGVCVMAMEKGLDTGPVINQESIDIEDTDNLEKLTNKLCKISSRLLIKSIKQIEFTKDLDEHKRLKKLQAIDQANLPGEPSYARQLKKEDFLINWNFKSKVILNKVKGLYPNAYTFFKGKRIKVIEAHYLTESLNKILLKTLNISSMNNLLAQVNPGDVIFIGNDYGIVVVTNDFPIIIKFGQLEGRNITDGYKLSIQAKIYVNDKLGN